jgi:hypothetical protein
LPPTRTRRHIAASAPQPHWSPLLTGKMLTTAKIRNERGRPPHLLVLPGNTRDGERSEIWRDDRGAPLGVLATDPAELERLTAQAFAELAEMFPEDDA